MASRAISMTSARGIGPLPALVDEMEGHRATQRLFVDVGLPLALIEEPGVMMPLRDLVALYERAARVTGNPLFGLDAGRAMANDFGPWSDYARSAPTLGACLARASRGLAFHQSSTRLSLSLDGPQALYTYHVPVAGPRARAQHVEHTLPALLSAFRRYTGPDWSPDAIEVDLPRDGRIASLERSLAIPIRCDCPAYAIRFQRAALAIAESPHVPLARRLTRRDLMAAINRRPPRDEVGAVRELIHLRFLDGPVDLDGVAAHLGIGARTLQRRLEAANHSFRDLLAQERQARACALLETSDTPITEIAYRLGYSDVAHFSRAFSRSLSVSPRAYRRQHAT